MPPELGEVREWLRKARHDRRMAEAGLAAAPPITDAAAFHCQQAAEKYVKAYLLHRGEPFELIHDLEMLMEQCTRLDPDWENLRDAVEPLTAYAVRFSISRPGRPVRRRGPQRLTRRHRARAVRAQPAARSCNERAPRDVGRARA